VVEEKMNDCDAEGGELYVSYCYLELQEHCKTAECRSWQTEVCMRGAGMAASVTSFGRDNDR